MMFLRCALALTMLAPPPTEVEALAAYNRGEMELALKLYQERAEAPGVHLPEALHGMHDSLIAQDRLCEAFDLARGTIARGGFADPKERASWVELAAQDAKRVEEAGRACVEQSDEAPKVSPRAGGATTGADEEKGEPPATSMPEGPAPLPVAKGSATPRRSVGRLVGFSLLAGAGVGLLGGMAGALVGAARADARVANITVRATGCLSPAGSHCLPPADQRSIDRLQGAAISAGVIVAAGLFAGLVIMIRDRVRAQRAKRKRSF